ncbi:MAG: Fe-S cluster domain-containing protein [Firmicutes bacterium]|nr:Fe-S cluster domain-containing protein [Bacillota bacterium]
MSLAVIIILVLSALGFVIGFGLAIASARFAVKEDPRIEEVAEILPAGQCGACGYPGCHGYAEAVVTNADVPPNLCVPGKEEVAEKVAEITGKKAEEVARMTAALVCSLDTSRGPGQKFEYIGIKDCVAANMLQGGASGCKYGCLGLGTCEAACPFDAIKMENGRPVIDFHKCTGCGVCVKACPRNSLALVPSGAPVVIRCHNLDKVPVKKKTCPSACLSCSLCMKNCAHGAITMVNNMPVIDYSKCPPDCTMLCIAKCPTKSIAVRFNGREDKAPVEEKEKAEALSGR